MNTKAMGKMGPVLIGLLTGLNEVEREMTRDRVLESTEHRKATGGSIGGRPKTNQAKERLVLRLREEGCSYRSIREQTGLALSTIGGSSLNKRSPEPGARVPHLPSNRSDYQQCIRAV